MNYAQNNLDDRKRAILKTWGICDLSNIVDMNDTDCTVTFDDGAVRTKTEVFTRVMGYHRPTFAFNPGKQQEHKDRLSFKESIGVARFPSDALRRMRDMTLDEASRRYSASLGLMAGPRVAIQ